VTADQHKLAQVIRNLVSNALKFTPPGGTVDVVAVIIPLELPPAQHTPPQQTPPSVESASGSTQSTTNYNLQINVIDTGVGVSKVFRRDSRQ